MAAPSGSSSGMPLMQPGQYDSTTGNLLNVRSVPSQREVPAPFPRSYGDSTRKLVLRQGPLHARVAVGKEKDRKPVDPPPILELIDNRPERNSPLYNSPYLFVVCFLLPENYTEPTKDSELVPTYLSGSKASSIYHLKDPIKTEGGFFVFGDLAIKREGRYRLGFTLYDRNEQTSPPSVYFVSELITDAFTVYSPKEFPGMSESTFLTRSFADQGVKLRLRKDSRAMTTRKRNKRAAESADALINQQFKRSNLDRGTSIGGFGGGSSHTLSSPEGGPDYVGTPDLGVISGPSASQPLLSTPNPTSSPVDAANTGAFLSSPISSQFPHTYPQTLNVAPANISSGTSIAMPTAYNQAYFTPDHSGMQHIFGDGTISSGFEGFNAMPSRSMVATPYGVALNHLEHVVPDMAPRTSGGLVGNQPAQFFMRTDSHENLDQFTNEPGNPFGVMQ